jgi:adenine-specific DNA-methyltransferase
MDGFMSEAKKKEVIAPAKLEQESMNISEYQIGKLRDLFPEAVTEKGRIDLARLSRTLGEFVDEGKERYGINWAGKSDCFRTIQRASSGTLVPLKAESVNFDTTRNAIIEGDNLEVLKLLQKSYLGKMKLIYIDPPYNTGSDFIYPDDFSETLETYLKYTGQVDAEGRKFSTNPETDGRYHSKWLTMMYPRLFLARNLLREDGLIAVSIDHHEFHNLKLIMDEVYGEENCIATIANVNNPKGRSDDKYIATAHEYLMIYSKGSPIVYGWDAEEKVTRRFSKTDSAGRSYREMDLRKTGDADRRVDRPNMFYPFDYHEATGRLVVASLDDPCPEGWMRILPLKEDGVEGRWRWGSESARAGISELIARKMPVKGGWSVFEKDYLSEDEKVKPTSAWTFKEVNSERGTEQFLELGFQKEEFPRPKPVGLLKRIIQFACRPAGNDIILDFFAGSGVTAQAVMEINEERGSSHKFILVQLPETTELGNFKTIAEVTRERVRRVGAKIQAEQASQNSLFASLTENRDVGFRAFQLTKSAFKTFDVSNDESSQPLSSQLQLHIRSTEPNRGEDDILFEILLRAGFEVTIPVEVIGDKSRKVFGVQDRTLVICLSERITRELINEMVALSPVRVVCLDSSFESNDQLKVNAVETFKAKGITFKTV